MADKSAGVLKKELVRIAREAYQNKLVTATSGNISARLPNGQVLITPHACSLGYVRPEDLLVVDQKGSVVRGKGEPSAEMLLHLAIYRSTSANAIVHTHPPYSVALSAAGVKPQPITIESAFILGDVDILNQQYPTTADITEKIVRALKRSKVVILKNHGVFAIGKDLLDAFFLTETLEETAKILSLSKLHGEVSSQSGWERIARQFHPDTIWFEWCTTNRCNLRCRYCYEGSKNGDAHRELTTEEAKKIIDTLSEASRLMGRPFVVCWSGGEPLLRNDIFELIEYAHGQGILNSIATNGTLLTPEKAERLKEAGICNVLISLDSVKTNPHDQLRGEGTHAKVLKAIELCKNTGLFTVVETVATRYNYEHINDIKNFCEQDLGVFFFYRPVLKVGVANKNWDDLGLSSQQFRELYEARNEEIFRKVREGKAHQIPVMRIFDLFPFMESPANNDEREYLEWGVGCQACRILHGITPTGDLLPCIRMKYPLGNLLKSSFTDIVNSDKYQTISHRKERKGKCGECQHLSVCGGGCLAEVLGETGNPLSGWSTCWR